jgi:addiction module RelE/StbE family toxin
MTSQFAPKFITKLKKQKVIIRKSFKERFLIFSTDPYYPPLNNHVLKGKWKGFRSIDITKDWRAIYEEIQEGKEIITYFVALGTHKELYK